MKKKLVVDVDVCEDDRPVSVLDKKGSGSCVFSNSSSLLSVFV